VEATVTHWLSIHISTETLPFCQTNSSQDPLSFLSNFLLLKMLYFRVL
jgi:hypothetical protein